jgi:hypothetical protein
LGFSGGEEEKLPVGKRTTVVHPIKHTHLFVRHIFLELEPVNFLQLLKLFY